MKVKALKWDAKGIFRKRPNRFAGVVDITEPLLSKGEKVHIHDPGRLEEILFPGNTTYLKHEDSPKRKTQWDIIAGEVNNSLVFINSKYHSEFAIWSIENLGLFSDVYEILPEYKLGKSRIDFLLRGTSSESFLETKGCTLVKEGVALFPDAPTERGRRHIKELIKLRKNGKNAILLFLVFREDATCFAPNTETDPEFSRLFFYALETGVKSIQLKFSYNGKEIKYDGKIPLCR